MDMHVPRSGFWKLLVAALLALAMPAAEAQDRAVTLRIDMPSRLALERAFETVMVADPEIADVRTDDDRSVVIEPHHPGVTNLIFVDMAGRVIANVRVTVCEAAAACEDAAGRT